jgi:hypothetical protein
VRIPRLLGRCALCLSILVASFLALEGLALRFSNDARIIANLQQAVAAGVLPAANYPVSPYGDTMLRYDMFEECTALSTNLGNEDKPLLFRLAETPFIGPASEHRCDPLRVALRTGAVATSSPYFRYWHGYQIYLRPLLSFMPLQKIHRINALLLIGAVAILIARLVAWFGIMAAPAFLIPFALGSDLLTVPAVSVHTLFLAWTFASVGFFAYAIQRRAVTHPQALTVVFCLGAVANYFDLLFNPTLAPTLLAFLVLWERMSREPHPHSIRGAIAAAAGVVVVWFSGYALAWASKWMFASAVLGVDVVVPDVMNAILFRIDGPVPGLAADAIGLFTPAYRALGEVGFTLIFTCIGIATLVLAGHFIAGRLTRSDIVDFAVLQLPLIVPLARAEILRNHTIIHAGFVSRTFVLFAVLPLIGALAVCHRSLAHRKKPHAFFTSKVIASVKRGWGSFRMPISSAMVRVICTLAPPDQLGLASSPSKSLFMVQAACRDALHIEDLLAAFGWHLTVKRRKAGVSAGPVNSILTTCLTAYHDPSMTHQGHACL